MEIRIGIVGIVVDDPRTSAQAVNVLLSEFADLIIGRMGLPYRKREISVISVMVEGTNERIGALCGKLGRIPGVSVKSLLTQKTFEEEK